MFTSITNSSPIDLSSSTQDIVNQGVLEVCDRSLYDLDRNRVPRINGPIDGRMGISSKNGVCETCGLALQQCNGHFGHVRLALPAFHIGYLKMIITILHEICKVYSLLSRLCFATNTS